MLPSSFFGKLSIVVPFAVVLFWLAVAVVHVLFAVAVYRHSTDHNSNGGRLVFGGPALWALAALVSGVLGATGYWLIHCTVLACTDAAAEPGPAELPTDTSLPQA